MQLYAFKDVETDRTPIPDGALICQCGCSCNLWWNEGSVDHYQDTGFPNKVLCTITLDDVPEYRALKDLFEACKASRNTRVSIAMRNAYLKCAEILGGE